MSKPDNVINLRPDAATIAPDRPLLGGVRALGNQ